MVAGIVLFAAAFYWNPFAGKGSVSPLAVTSSEILELDFSMAAEESIAYVNSGESRRAPHPDRIQPLWEPAIADTTVMVTVLRDVRKRTAGIGIKFSSGSEAARLLNAEVLVDSVWHIWLPEHGSLMIEQTENRWPWLRDVVIPAIWSSGDNWRGAWYGIVTSGPNALGTARLSGGSGSLRDLTGEAVEAIKASAYSADSGPVDVKGSLTLALPRQ
jgi:hypothetical protein